MFLAFDESSNGETGREIGIRAAWRYLQLAMLALRPAWITRPRLPGNLPPLPPAPAWVAHWVNPPAVSLATRLYLLFNVVLYGVVAVAFLLDVPGLHVAAHTGFVAMDVPLLHLLWGWGALFVCLSQIAALLSSRWSVWQVCATATATWASAFAVIEFYAGIINHSYGGFFIWFWVVGVHFLFISHQLVPHARTDDIEQDEPAGQHHTPEEEAALIAELERIAELPTPSPLPESPSRPTRRASSPH